MNVRIVLSIFCLLGLVSGCQEKKVTIYSIDKNDYNYSHVEQVILSQEAANTKYGTIILVNDGAKNIAKWESDDNITFSDSEFRRIVESIKESVKRDDPFDGILGFYWGMTVDDVVDGLKRLNITSWKWSEGISNIMGIIRKDGNGQISKFNVGGIDVFKENIYCNGVIFDAMFLSFGIFQSENIKRLNEIHLIKGCTDEKEAKSMMETILSALRLKYGYSAVEKGKDEMFRQNTYVIYDPNRKRHIPRIEIYQSEGAWISSIGLIYCSPNAVDFFD